MASNFIDSDDPGSDTVPAAIATAPPVASFSASAASGLPTISRQISSGADDTPSVVTPAPSTPASVISRDAVEQPIAETLAAGNVESTAQPNRLSLPSMLLATGIPNTTYELHVGGVTLGEVTTDAGGNLIAELTPVANPLTVIDGLDARDSDTSVTDETSSRDSATDNSVPNESGPSGGSNDQSPNDNDPHEFRSESVDEFFGNISGDHEIKNESVDNQDGRHGNDDSHSTELGSSDRSDDGKEATSANDDHIDVHSNSGFDDSLDEQRDGVGENSDQDSLELKASDDSVSQLEVNDVSTSNADDVLPDVRNDSLESPTTTDSTTDSVSEFDGVGLDRDYQGERQRESGEGQHGEDGSERASSDQSNGDASILLGDQHNRIDIEDSVSDNQASNDDTSDDDGHQSREVDSIDSQHDDRVDSVGDDDINNDRLVHLDDLDHHNDLPVDGSSDNHDVGDDRDTQLGESDSWDDDAHTPVVSAPVVSAPVTPVDHDTADSQVAPVASVPDTPVVAPQHYGKWSGRLSGDGYGKIEFKRESRESKFEVKIRNVAANATYPISVAGIVVGQIRTDSRGRGKLEFEIGDDHHRPFPSDFPAITNGVNVQVGDLLTGVFGQSVDDDNDHGHDDDDHDRDHDRHERDDD